MKNLLILIFSCITWSVVAQQQTIDFFKRNEVNHPFWSGFRYNDNPYNLPSPNVDSKGNTWTTDAPAAPEGQFYVTRNYLFMGLPLSPKKRPGYRYSSRYDVTTNEFDTKFICVSGFREEYIDGSFITYHDNYVAKYDTLGGLQYIHARDLGDNDSINYWKATFCVGNQLFVQKSNRVFGWGSSKLKMLHYDSLGTIGDYRLFFDKQSTLYCISMYYSPFLHPYLLSFHADGTYRKRLPGKIILATHFDSTNASFTVYAKDSVYELQGKTEKRIIIPSYNKLAVSYIMNAKTLQLGNYKVDVLLTRRGMHVKEGKNSVTYLFSGKGEINKDSLYYTDTKLYQAVALQEDSTVVFAYQSENIKYLFTYNNGEFSFHKKFDLNTIGKTQNYNTAFYVGNNDTYFFLARNDSIFQFKNNIISYISTRNQTCYSKEVIVATKNYLWFGLDQTEFKPGHTFYTEPCAVGRLVHDTFFINGKVYYDNNTNGYKDDLENGFNNLKLLAMPSGIRLYPDPSGNFAFKGEPGKKYTFLVEDSALFSSVKISTSNGISIGVKYKQEILDVSTYLNLTSSRCATMPQATFVLANRGSLPVEKVVVRLIPDKMKLQQNGSNVDTAVFTFNNLQLLTAATGTFDIEWPTGEQVGQTATLTSITDLYVDGKIASSKTDSIQTIIRCSYDPNDKSVSPVGIGTNRYTLKNNPLKFQIRFENTGNDTAYHISIKDTLNSNLDLKSFQILGSSHNMNTDISPGGIITFHFNNIMLPDSTTNKKGAQGYLQYSIQPKTGLADNTLICNSAAIYFDQNKPVFTNTTCNLLVDKIPSIVTGLENPVLSGESNIYPNPAQSEVSLPKGTEETIFYNTLGKDVLHSKGENTSVINLEEGIYIAKIRNKDGRITTYKISILR